MTVTAFLRLSTSRVVFRSPLAASDATSIVEGWLARPNVMILEPTHRHWQVFRELIGYVGTAGNLATDAHLAALAIEHGATLESADHDFGRFRGLRWEDPLA
jgi:toxin-antitoxin system PIN domain toxin